MKRIVAFLMMSSLAMPALAHADAHSSSNAKALSGFTLALGGTASLNTGSADTNYNYTNLFGGSATAPGFSTSGRYTLNEDKTSVAPVGQAGYSLPIGNNFLLGVLGSYDLASTENTYQADSMAFPNPTGTTDNLINYSMKTTVKSNNHWSVGIEPGYAFSNRFAGFLRLSYQQMNADIRTTSSASPITTSGSIPALTNPSPDETFRGVGVGIGGKYFMTPNVFIQPVAEWIHYGSKTVAAPGLTSGADEITLTQSQRISPSSLNATISVGYRF